jgi:predicted transcriptional regulator
MTRRSVCATLPVPQVKRLDEIADTTGLTRSALLKQAVEAFLTPKRTRRPEVRSS